MGKRSRKQKESVAPGFDAVDYSAEYLSWMAELSYRTELSRHDSYERLSNCLLSCVSIISVALLTVAPLLFERYSYNDNGAAASFVLLASGYVVVMLLLGASFLLSLLSQVRLKMSVLASPTDLKEYVAGEVSRGAPFASPMEVAEGKAKAVQPHFESLNRKNEYMRKFLKASMILLIVAVSVCLFLVCLFSLFDFLLPSFWS